MATCGRLSEVGASGEVDELDSCDILWCRVNKSRRENAEPQWHIYGFSLVSISRNQGQYECMKRARERRNVAMRLNNVAYVVGRIGE